MRGRARRSVGVAVVGSFLSVLLVACVSPAEQSSSPRRTLVGRTPPDQPVAFDLVLRVPGRDRLREVAARVSDPRSPSYRQFLAPAEIGEEFGLPAETVDATIERLADAGIQVVDRYAQRTALRVRGPARAVESLVRVQLSDYRDRRTGVRFHAPDRRPSVPPGLRGAVIGVVGLDTEPTAQPLVRPGRRAARPGYLRPEQLRSIYGIDELHRRGFDGAGQTVAIVSFDNATQSDIATWDERMGVRGPPFEDVPVDGGTTPGVATAEVTLDIQMIRALAPQAQILNYETRNGNGFTGIVNRIVDDRRASIVSVSWGRCESHRASPVRDAEETAFTAAAAAGISVFVASGDSGAYGCRGAERPGIVPSTYMADLRVDTLYPAGSPHVIAVGGTSTRFGPGFTYEPEAAWEDPLSHWATGGGSDAHFARPGWQRGSGVEAAAEGRERRQVPDVAGPADNFVNLYHFYTDAETGRPVEGTMGGTSAAAPFWAGYLTLVQQQAAAAGVGSLGFVAPILYDLAATSTPGSVFHDVTSGGNLLTEATRGWDFATGLGSPRAPQLADAIVEHLRDRPVR